jgi:protein ImuB
MAPGPAKTRSEIGGAVRGSAPPAMLVAVFDLLATLERWGLRTLGDVARLPRADVHARLGPPGVRLHQAACGEDTAWFVPADAPPRFLERHVLDWPIEALEPLSFVLARLLDALSVTLERADRGAVEIATRLQLVTRATHTRLLNLPAPMRDARVLRTLILLDLESHPPPAGIDIVEVEVGVVPGRIVQGTLLARATPTPEHLSTLIARLGALMGETRVGAPGLLDTHDDRPVAMKMFAPVQQTPSSPNHGTQELQHPGTCIRRFRIPLSARVQVEHGAPVHVAAPVVSAGEVVACAGPWRSSGGWWVLDGARWDRDEWDVELAGGECYRLARDRTTNRWEIDGELD